MATEDLTRRLSAILSADVEGYSRLMREDEEATVQTLTTYRTALTHLINQYRGRVVDSPGDNILAEFTSVVDAVNCGVEIQRELAERNAELPDNRRMRFRIGINLGDVLEEGERIYGDGVNIAARMESLAEAGEICISGMVYDAIEKKIGLEYEYLGEQEVKNIDKPVRAYRVLSYPGAAAHRVVKAKRAVGRTWRNVVVAIVAIIVVGAAVAVWHFYFRPPPIEVASVERMAFPLPDKPSIAVLPFVNMSEDPKQEYFSDGLTEDIITALSKVPKLFVIARNSTFSYKGKAVKVNQVAEELGVRYVLEGSVRKAGDRVRITAQLIDATTGHHMWGERYDRDLKDIFALQDEITVKILNALQVELIEGEMASVLGKGTKNLEAYLKLLQARKHAFSYTKEGSTLCRRLLEEVITIDPEYPLAYVGLSYMYLREVISGSSKSPEESLRRAMELAQKSLSLDDSFLPSRALLCLIYSMKRQHDKAIAEGERAVALNPNHSFGYLQLGGALTNAGRPEEAIGMIKRAIRLDPLPRAAYFRYLGDAYRVAKRHREAIEAYKKALDISPEYLEAHLGLAATYSEFGREEEAISEAAEVIKIDPKFSLERYAKTLPYKNKAHIERYLAALRKAGLPETPPLPLPDKPSIAVLPFTNMSGDPEQEYFSDGITEEIITAISKTPKLFVIARTSSFKYKGKEVDVRTVGRELGVRYVVEGSVRRAEDQLRITAQLVDGKTGKHLWAERYDRDLKDVFAVQDEITKKIITALQVKLTRGEQASLEAKGTDNLDAYIKFLQAREHWSRFNKEENALAKQMAKQAINLDPQFPGAYWILGWTHVLDVYYKSSKSPKESLKKAFILAQKSIALDDSYAPAYSLLGYILVMKREHDKAIAQGERAVALNPNSDYAHAMLARSLNFAERCEESIVMYKKALRLNPFPSSGYYYQLAGSYNCAGKYEDAIEAGKKAVHLEPNNLWAHLVLIMPYYYSGREQEARAEAAEVLRIAPKFSVEHFAKTLPLKNQARVERWVEALRKAGLK